MSDVISQWIADGPSSFGPLTQAILATQNPTVAAQVGIVRTDAYERAILDAISGLESA
jgi:hypothetical protein